jgi:antitoxin component YwqK of YwqJK toxin-antitoxin module
MKTTINIIISSIILLMIACKSKSNKVVSIDAPPCTIIQAPMDGNFTSLPYATNFVYYNWYKVKTDVCRVNPFLLKDNFEIAVKKGEGSDIINNDPNRGYNFGTREGEFKNGKQHGLWQCQRNYYLDSLGHHIYKKYKFREEYFKNGLRDSIYKIYNKKGDIVYSTYFKNGTGLEKDFHENGKLYYEIQTKDGYFTDTLKLYNDKGNLVEKLLYKKDSLVYDKRL